MTPGTPSALPVHENLVLGLDIGANSVGWALLEKDPSGACEFHRIVAAGSRVFEAAGELIPDKVKGTNVKGYERRMARSRRRLLERRRRRMLKLLHALQRTGLLPQGDPDAPGELAQVLQHDPAANQSLYALRARALDEALAPHELGRAIYHLAHRRGFESNKIDKAMEEKALQAADPEPDGGEEEPETGKGKRKAGKSKRTPKEPKPEAGSEAAELAQFKKDLADQEQAMLEKGARTWGEFLAGLNPHESRIRGRRTKREWFKDEFEKIWAAQAPHRPQSLTPAARREIHKAIFFQRPLKSVAGLVGLCDLERDKRGEPCRRRAPLAWPISQRFRILQQLNNTKIEVPGKRQPVPLRDRKEVALALLGRLEQTDKLSFAEARKLCGLEKGERFNMENAASGFFIGDRTAAKLAPIFGHERWAALSADEKQQAVEDIRSYSSQDGLKRRGMKRWGLSPGEAERFAAVGLEDGYAAHSRRAMENLLPFLEQGKTYSDAKDKAYPPVMAEPLDRIPPFEYLRNPIVQRALAETRRVVNEIVAQYGKPGLVRIELARDLKKSPKQRLAIEAKNHANQKEREAARKEVAVDRGVDLGTVKPGDILKFLLFKECGGVCPYTGRCIPKELLYTDAIDIEHIIPYSRSFDDSFLNKTLCFAEENRGVKRNRTPYEAYHHDKDRYEAMLERVRKFNLGPAQRRTRRGGSHPKLERFEWSDAPGSESFINEFTNAQLNATAYAARKARLQIASLYGGAAGERERRIEVTTGQVTAHLRKIWDMNRILSDKPEKTREDHRHHAVDAIVTALVTRGTIQRLARCAEEAERQGQRPGRLMAEFAPPLPWPSFQADAKAAVDRIVVSHRVDKSVNGPLHQETFYGVIEIRDEAGKPVLDKTGKAVKRAVARTRLTALTASDIRGNLIVDPVVRAKVHAKIEELAGAPLAQLPDDLLKKAVKEFEKPENLPIHHQGPPDGPEKGKAIPIRKVRVFQKVEPEEIGKGARARHVKTGGNDHLAVYLAKDKKGAPAWRGEVVTRFEAMRRRRFKEPVIRPTDEQGNPLLFSLAIGEAVELDWNGKREIGPPSRRIQPGTRVIANVRKLSVGSPMIVFQFHCDAREAVVQMKDNFYAASPSSLQGMKVRKLEISPLGEISEVNNARPNP